MTLRLATSKLMGKSELESLLKPLLIILAAKDEIEQEWSAFCASISSLASLDAPKRGRDNCNLLHHCTADKQWWWWWGWGGARLAIFFGFLFNTMRACTSNHPSHLIRECHWTKQELGQVWTEATQALYLERVWMVSVICCDIWQTLTNPWCGFLYLAWQGVARPVDGSFKLFLQILP